MPQAPAAAYWGEPDKPVTQGCPAPNQQINPAYVAWLRQQDQVRAVLGMRNPTWMDEQIKMLFRCGLAR
jgi:hypothetical protein